MSTLNIKKPIGSKRTQSFITVALVVVILLIINVLASYFDNHIDLTEEKRQ